MAKEAAEAKAKGKGKPLQRIQHFIQEDPTAMADEPAVTTQRQKRMKRQQKSDYARRIFVEGDRQVASAV